MKVCGKMGNRFKIGDKGFAIDLDGIPHDVEIKFIKYDGTLICKDIAGETAIIEPSQFSLYWPKEEEVITMDEISSDPTNPNYYKSGKYEIFDVLMDWIEAEKLDGHEAALIFNTVKYLRRFKSKHPDDKTVDLKKAKWYLDKLISYEAGDSHDDGAVS